MATTTTTTKTTAIGSSEKINNHASNSGSIGAAAADPATCPLFPSDGNDNHDYNQPGDTKNNVCGAAEKSRRRLLNKHLKQRNKLRKYETRVQQGILRNEKAIVEQARKDWKEYHQRLQEDPNSVLNYDGKDAATNTPSSSSRRMKSKCCQLNQGSRYQDLHQSLRSSEERETGRVREGSALLLKFWMQLATLVVSSSPPSSSSISSSSNEIGHPVTTSTTTAAITKKQQTIRAAELKANMQRGTQTESMFDDELALLGYTRQKFYERAVLAFASLDRLDPTYRDNISADTVSNYVNNINGNDSAAGGIGLNGNCDETDSENDDLVRCMWYRLMNTKQLISIGCGPGCDATGVLGFLTSHEVQIENGILLMDFVVDRWKKIVLDQLIRMLVPLHVPFVKTVRCDVRDSLLQEQTTKHAMTNYTSNNNNHRAFLELGQESISSNRLVVVSYLLTETRHKWKSFFQDLLSMLQGSESLLLLTEPTGWQLHEFLECFSTAENNLVKTHVWLDSSRDLPHLQTLDKRNGPAILMVCTN